MFCNLIMMNVAHVGEKRNKRKYDQSCDAESRLQHDVDYRRIFIVRILPIANQQETGTPGSV